MACLFPKQDMCQPEMAGIPWSVLPCGVDAFQFWKIAEGEWLYICFCAEVKVTKLGRSGLSAMVWQAV